MADVAVNSRQRYIGLYAKALAAGAVSALGAYSAAVTDGSGVSGSEFVGIILALIVGLGAVWAVPNLPANVAAYLKAIVGAVVAGLTALGTGLTDGSLSTSEIVTAVIAFITGLGLVAATSNAAESDPVDSDSRLVGVTRAQKSQLVTYN